jgi:hypothetical protein
VAPVGEASRSAPVAQPRNVTQNASPGTGGLRGRVTTDRNPGPRAGLFCSLGAMFQSVVRFFSRGAPEGSRLHTQQAQPAPVPQLPPGFEVSRDPLYNRVQESFAAVAKVMTSKAATPAAVAAALEDAAAATDELRRAGGSPDFALLNFRNSIIESKKKDHELMQLARAFKGAPVGDAQTLCRSDDAQYVLLNMEHAVLDELNYRLPRNASREALVTALDGLRAGESGARIGAQFHAAFDSALPLVRAGLRQAAPVHHDVTEFVWDQLRSLPQEELEGLLKNASSEDLARLKASTPAEAENRAKSLRSPELTAALDKEVAARTTHLADTFRERAKQFCDRHDSPDDSPGRIDHQAFQHDLVALAASLDEVEAHCRLHGVAIPPYTWPTKGDGARLQEQLARVVEAAFEPPRGIDPQTLGSGALVHLSNAVRALRLPGLSPELAAVFRPAQQACMESKQEVFRARFSAFVSCAMSAGVTASGPRRLLHSLAELEDASRALQNAQMAFDWEPEQRAQGAQDELIRECLAQTPAAAEVLRAQLGSKDHQGMLSALHVGADLASVAQERQLQERFGNMAHLYEQVAQAAGAEPSGASSRAEHQKFAAQNLPAEARDMLRQNYGLLIPADAAPVLHSGRFNPLQVQTMREVFEAPLAPSESKLISIGGYEISEQFYLDAIRVGMFRIEGPDPDHSSEDPAARPVIDHPRPLSRGNATSARPSATRLTKMPIDGDEEYGSISEEEAKLRVEEGVERLVQLCGGDAALARTITMYASQRIFSGLYAGCYTFGFPVPHLPDGTPALDIAGNQYAGSATRKQISISIGENGRPQFDLDWRIEGRGLLIKPDGTLTVLSPESYVQAHFRAEIDAEGRLRLLEAPSYHFDLEPDDFQKTFAPPTLEQVRTAPDGHPGVEAILAYARGIGQGHQVPALRAIEIFERAPTPANAAEVIKACDAAPKAVAMDLVPEPIRKIVGRAAGTAGGGQPLSVSLFADLEQRLSASVETDIIQGMIQAVREGRF